jgi:hypothetical protein
MWCRLNSGTERILEVGECGGFGHCRPTTRRKGPWRQGNHRLGEELRRGGRLGGGSGAGDSQRSARNQANPMTGSRVQQTCKPCAEKAAEVGQNDKGGTCSGVANPNLGQPSEDAHGDVGGGAVFEELHERSPRESVTSVTGRRGRQASQCVSERGATGTRCVRDGGSCLRIERWPRTTWARERPTTHSVRCPVTCKRHSTGLETNPGRTHQNLARSARDSEGDLRHPFLARDFPKAPG